jgi:transcription elongation factor Elf1
MSFEGYYQVICKNGHHSTEELDFNERLWKCPFCNEGFAWTHIVDLTNGSWDNKNNRIDGYKKLKIKKSAKFCTCKDCGNKHIIEQEIYIIPKVGR